MTHSIAGPQFLPLTTAYVSRGPTGRLKSDRAHLSTGPSHARPHSDLLGVVPSPQPAACSPLDAPSASPRKGDSLDHSWRRIELKLSVRCSMRSPPPATERVMADFPCVSTKAPVRLCVSVVVAALVLTGCDANQAINPSGQSGRCANDAGCDPYNPISYAQNNTGNRSAGR